MVCQELEVESDRMEAMQLLTTDIEDHHPQCALIEGIRALAFSYSFF